MVKTIKEYLDKKALKSVANILLKVLDEVEKEAENDTTETLIDLFNSGVLISSKKFKKIGVEQARKYILNIKGKR